MNDAKSITVEHDGRTFSLRRTGRSWYRSEYGAEVDIVETTGGASRLLTDGVDPVRLEELTDEVLASFLTTRKQNLVTVMRTYKIVAGDDYQYEDDYLLLYSAQPCGRFVAVSGDETYHWIDVTDTLDAALDSLACDLAEQVGNEYPHRPVSVWDLDTGKEYSVHVNAVVTLAG